ncbi:hypothetical protein RQP46_010068 [Phenoliferia psychrophenolica]
MHDARPCSDPAPAAGLSSFSLPHVRHSTMSTTLQKLPPTRYLILTITVFLIALHFLLSLSSATYISSVSELSSRLGVGASELPTTWYGGHKRPFGWLPPGGFAEDEDATRSEDRNSSRRANATFVILAKNEDLWGIVSSIRSMEDRFNKDYHYPYTFLNEVPFTDEFKLHTSAIASGTCSYGLIPRREWDELPEWIDMDKVNKGIEEMGKLPIPYGGSLSYRKMCRYQSGFFFRSPLLDKYRYYWRVEPNVKYFCDLKYDPFLFMQENKKKYGWVVTIYEYAETIPTLWNATKRFIETHPQYLANDSKLMRWISPDGGKTYNLCHFWSNFEIGDLDFWRSEAYTRYFDFLDREGGFFYERWGDAPVHSLAAILFLKPEELHYFQDIGYRHEPFQHCPKDRADTCACNP